MKPILSLVVLLSSKGEAWRALLNYFKMRGGGGGGGQDPFIFLPCLRQETVFDDPV